MVCLSNYPMGFGLHVKEEAAFGGKLLSLDSPSLAHFILSEIMGHQDGALRAHDTEGSQRAHLRVGACAQLHRSMPLTIALPFPVT